MKKNFKIAEVFGNGMTAPKEYLVEHLPTKKATVSYKRKGDAARMLNKASDMEDNGKAFDFPFEHIMDGDCDLGYWL